MVHEDLDCSRSCAKHACAALGNESLEFSKLKRTLIFLHIGSPGPAFYSLATTIRNHGVRQALYIATAKANCSLLDLLDITNAMACTDPRDRFFALNGMAVEAKDKNWPLHADYNLSMKEVLSRFGRWNVEKNKALNFLYSVSWQYPLQKLGPTWIPEFNAPHPSFHRHSFLDFCASGNTDVNASVSLDGSSLSVRGIIVDRIAGLESLPRHKALSPDSRAALNQLGWPFLKASIRFEYCQDFIFGRGKLIHKERITGNLKHESRPQQIPFPSLEMRCCCFSLSSG